MKKLCLVLLGLCLLIEYWLRTQAPEYQKKVISSITTVQKNGSTRVSSTKKIKPLVKRLKKSV